MQDNISCALITAFERQYDASWDDPKLRNERLAMRYGWTAAMEAKQCLHQIQEPAAAEQAAWHAGLDEGRVQADARDADGAAFRTAARLGLTLRFYGNCAQSGAPGTPSVYEVTTGPGSAEAMRASIDRAAIAAAKVSGGTPAHYLVDEHYPTEASERGTQAAQGGEA